LAISRLTSVSWHAENRILAVSNDTWVQINTHTHIFKGPLTGTTGVSRYQKGKTNLDFTEARDSEWQRHQLGHTQVCNVLQTHNHTSTPPLCFFTGRMPYLPPNQVPTASKHWRHYRQTFNKYNYKISDVLKSKKSHVNKRQRHDKPILKCQLTTFLQCKFSSLWRTLWTMHETSGDDKTVFICFSTAKQFNLHKLKY